MEPDPSNYSNAQNYINALVNHWSRFGGPANQNRAISVRLQMYFNKLNKASKNQLNHLNTLNGETNRIKEEIVQGIRRSGWNSSKLRQKTNNLTAQERKHDKEAKKYNILLDRIKKFHKNSKSKFVQSTHLGYKMKQEIREKVLRNFFTKELPRAFQTQFKLPTEIVRKIISREVYPKSLHVAIPFRNITRLPIMAYRNKRGDIYNIRWTEKGPFLQKMQRRNTNNRSNNENYRNSNTSNSNK